MDEETLREHARAAIAAKRIPAAATQHTWGGPGVGAECSICGRRIGQSEIELEVQFSQLDSHHLHLPCFAAWALERDGAMEPKSA